MIKERTKDIIGLAARLIVGAVFIYAGFVKTVSPVEEFAYAIEGYSVFPPKICLWAAYIVPWLELYAGGLLATGLFTRYMALFIGAMLVFFEIMLGQAALRSLPITSCGCFGASGSNSITHEFVQNLILLALTYMASKYAALTLDETVKTPVAAKADTADETLP